MDGENRLSVLELWTEMILLYSICTILNFLTYDIYVIKSCKIIIVIIRKKKIIFHTVAATY